jgi:hypothetical protein
MISTKFGPGSPEPEDKTKYTGDNKLKNNIYVWRIGDYYRISFITGSLTGQIQVLPGLSKSLYQGSSGIRLLPYSTYFSLSNLNLPNILPGHN